MIEAAKAETMSEHQNEMGQPVGAPIANWSECPRPAHSPMIGRYCRLEPLNSSLHAQSLYDANAADFDGKSWTYLPYGPFQDQSQYRDWIERTCSGHDPPFYAIIDLLNEKAVGVASYLRIKPAIGSIEVGHIHYSAELRRKTAATEAMYLLMAHAFDLGYRRYEWKCHALNAASRVAAQRLGLSFEGVFRQSTVMKGRNRDTAWFAAIDSQWPAIREAFIRWLDPSNFDDTGQQRVRLSKLTNPILHRRE